MGTKKGLSNLVMNPICDCGTEYDEESDEWRRVNDFEAEQKENAMVNVPKPIIFELFPNLEEIYLYTTTGKGTLPEKGKYHEFPFAISAFLSFVDAGPPSIRYLINAWRQKDANYEYFGQTWLRKVNLSAIDQAKFEIEFKNGRYMPDGLKIVKRDDQYHRVSFSPCDF